MAIVHQCLVFLFLFLLQNATSASALLIGHPYNNNSHSHFSKNPSHRPQLPLRRPHPVLPTNRSSCDLFRGEWVRDETYPLYRAEECGGGIIDPGFDCQTYGRPDSEYLKFRWQPFNCDVPRFNGLKFLEKMRGKTIMFVGDSLGRNQWESLMCMISSSAPFIHSHITREDPLSTFNILEYNVKVSFYRAPYLVNIDNVHGKTTLKLDQISVDASDAWRTADVLLFNTGHWWTHTGSIRGWVQMETGGRYYEDMDRLVALRKGLRTWSNWILRHINTPLTRVFFLSVSPTHYNPNEWISRAKAATTTTSGGKSCYGQTTPYSGTTYPTSSYIDQKKVIDEIVKEMKFHVSLMDISMLSALRIDGHPSIYSGDLNPSLKRNPDRSSDCSHWCLPGLPDTWNQLVYADLLYSSLYHQIGQR